MPIQRDATTLGPYDILCGRHKDAFNNVGNRRFRVTVSLWFSRYTSASSRLQKSFIIQSIHDTTRQAGGRFLKRRGRVYQELNQKQVHEKIGHALRDMALSKKDVPAGTVSSCGMESGYGKSKAKRCRTVSPLTTPSIMPSLFCGSEQTPAASERLVRQVSDCLSENSEALEMSPESVELLAGASGEFVADLSTVFSDDFCYEDLEVLSC